jgi:hypothetical protein
MCHCVDSMAGKELSLVTPSCSADNNDLSHLWMAIIVLWHITKWFPNRGDAWFENGLNSISQNRKVNLVIEDTNMIICVGQGVVYAITYSI